MRLVEGREIGIDHAQGNSADQASETDRAGGYLQYPMELERSEPSEKNHPEGEQEKEGTCETNGMNDDQSGEGT